MAVINIIGSWDANSNLPPLPYSANGGDTLVISVQGTRNIGQGVITYLSGRLVTYNSTTSIWEYDGDTSGTISPIGGTVTSVNLALPSYYNVIDGPVTTSGTITVVSNPALPQGQALMTPVSGMGPLTLRSITMADLPSVLSSMMSTTSSPLTTKGDLYTFSITNTRLGVGSNGQLLIADSSQSTGLRWGTVSGTGSVTSVDTASGQLTGGPITTSGVIGLASAGTSGTYGSSTQVPVFTTDAYGRVISVTNTNITTTSGTVTSVDISSSDLGVTGNPITSSGTINLSLNTVNSNIGTWNNVTVNAKGLVTAASNVAYLTSNQSITLSGDVSGTGTTTIVTAIGASKVGTTMIQSNAVTYVKIQQVSSSVLLGNPTGSTANLSEITLGSGLSFSGTSLIATGSGGTVTSITIGTGLTGSPNPITGTGTISMPNVGTAGTYGTLSTIPRITTDAQGRVSTVSTVSILTNTLDTFAAPVGNVSWNSQRITNLSNPVSANDAANKSYVDAAINGLQIKQTATVATTTGLPTYTYNNGSSGVGATITVTATGAVTIDSHVLVSGDIVLVKNETSGNAPYNGLYSVTTAGATGISLVLARIPDMNSASQFSGAFVPVDNVGPINSNTLWIANPIGTVTVGTTAIPFTQVASPTTYTGTAGVNISGTTVSLDYTYAGTFTNATWNGVPITGTYIASSVALGGAPTTTTASTADNSTKIATTAYVQAQGYTSNLGTVTSVAFTSTDFAVSGSPITSSGTITANLLIDRMRALKPTDPITTNYTATANQLIPCNTQSGAITITLPTAPADRTVMCIKLVVQGTGNNVTVACGGSDVFNRTSGGTTATLSLLNQGFLLQYYASTSIWYILADDMTLSSLDARYVSATAVQSPNFVFAGPAVGSTSLAPTFRQLASADIPNLIDHNITVLNPATNAIGYLGIPQNLKNSNYTTLITDTGEHLYHTDTSAYTWTIDSNANVAFPIGTSITFINDGTGVITIAITSDTLVFAGAGTTGSRSLARYGMATAIKVASTRWFINGTGLT